MSIETYGRYQLLKRLATGGMAQIYLARPQGAEPDKRVVVKRILPHLAENDDFVKMFLDEARIAARLNHPNVVQIFDLGAQDDSFFIAMEYIHGDDLRQLWKHSELMGQPLPVPLVCRILIEACAGLDYAHKRTDPTTGRPLGIVHRDVSPQNILVTFEGGVKVVDFGIAKAADQATVTRSGVLKGKYSYMSPEQAAGMRVDCRADIFALGIVLYELLTGTRLFKRPNDIQTLTAVSECRVVPPSQVTPRVPADLDAIVLKALAKDLSERYQEAAQLQHALEEWLARHHAPATSAHLSAFVKEVFAERLAEEARAGDVLGEDLDSGGSRPESPPRRTGLRPALPPRPPPLSPEDDATAALRPRPPSRTGRFELEPEKPAPRPTGRFEPEPEPRPAPRLTGRSEPEPEPRPAPRLTGQRRAVEPERPSRSGMGALPPLPPPVEEDAPTVDARAASRETRTDVKLGGAAAAPTDPRGAPRPSGLMSRFDLPASVDDDEDAPTLDARAGARAEVRGGHEVEEDAPTIAMMETASRPARVVLPLRDGEPLEEDAPTLSLGMSRPARRAGAPAASGGSAWLFVGLGLLLAVAVGVVFWSMRSSEPEVVPVAAEPEARAPVPEPRPALTELQPPPVVPQPPVEAAPAPVRLRIETQPEDAVVLVDGARQAARPVVLEAAVGQQVAVRVEAERHQALERTVTVGAGAEQVARFTLEPEPRPTAAVAAVVRERPTRPEPRTESRTARVRFVVHPWAEVTCGGKRLGETPFEAVDLRVGSYDCRFVNADLKKTLSKRIEVKPIDLNVVSVKFE
ncbi:protein kinase domain-containing protein [Corallococcus macrosporus]|uniref:serine/threonine-protein kinase n=1 Tax=Corallococcus macrosporus TaxID=35 RepID=UPI00195A81F0|nr:serine/threonine-protein kinase [Corallococcus macrosporus]